MYERMLAEHDRLQTQINSLQEQLSTFPDGKLVCTHNGKYLKWFQSDGHTQKYLTSDDHSLIEQLAIKKYLTLQLENLLHEQKAITFYLRHHNADNDKAEKLLTNNPEYQTLLSSFFTPLSQELSSWATSSYIRNTSYPELLIHKTISGIYVRSKSETIIDMFLYKNRIPFRYECALQLGSSTIFPDFTIRHPKTGKFFYWEHFGLLDNKNYIQNMNSKLQLYINHGIIPSVQLITTYETKEHPLNSEIIEKIIEYYFL